MNEDITNNTSDSGDQKEKVPPVEPPTEVKSSPPPVSQPTTQTTVNPSNIPRPNIVVHRPDAAKGPVDDSIDRRTFVKWLVIGWTAFAAVVGGYSTMVLRFLFPNVLFEPKQTFKAGYPDEYSIGDVSERWKEKHATWVVRDEEKIFALSTVCTHLGCTPNWLANEGKFKCPCHGSGFYKTGINFEGPAPRPLERFKIYISEDGQIVIDKTKMYQQEKGEWNDPDSYLVV